MYGSRPSPSGAIPLATIRLAKTILQVEKGTRLDLVGADFRGVNLNGINVDGLDLSHCYFRQADLRGLDMRGATLDGASIHAARISGVYFPDDFSAEGLAMSLLHGRRLRPGK